MFGLDTAYAAQIDNQLMNKQFGEVVPFLQGRLAQRDDPWDRYFLALAHLAAGDAQGALFDMAKLIITKANDVTRYTPEEVALLGAWGMQLVAIAEIPWASQEDAKASIVGIGLLVAESAAKILNRPQGYETRIQKIRQRFWQAVPEGASCQRHYLRPHSPHLLQVEPTNHCNLECVMCPRRHMTRSLGFMDLGLWQRILATWANRSGSKVFENLALPGNSRIRVGHAGIIKLFFLGEPLLHKQLPEMVALAKQYGCHVAVQTNGTLLDRPLIRQRLLDACPDEVGLSIDGTDAASYQAVRVNAQWSDLVAGVRALHRERSQRGLAGRMMLHISSILVENNEHSRQQINRFLDPLLDVVEGISVISLDQEFNPEFLGGGDDGPLTTYPRKAKGKPDPCTALCNEPMHKLNILWDGRMTPCCTDTNGVVNLGHVQDEGGVDGVWNGEKVLALQKAFFFHDLTAQPFCKACLS